MFPDVQTMNNYINGGRGGAGGAGYWNGTGGAGGDGLGPSLNFDILSGGNFIMNNAFQKGEMGKSAIMQTLARQLENGRRLGGSFFFKRGHDTRGNGRTVFATIAYQLALRVPWLRGPISQIVENDPSIVRQIIQTQMNDLIFEPCRLHENCDHATILIDGLDECDGHDVQQEIIRVIQITASHLSIPLRFIVASRPEPHIREAFDSAPSFDVCRFNVEQAFDDVRKYLCDEFARIHREHSTMSHIALPWPSSNILWELVWKSSGYFIYASTIIKFIDDKSYRPTKRLALVLNENTGSAFDALDQLYITVLSSAPRQEEFMPILCILVKTGGQGISTLDELLELEKSESKLLLRGLYSVIKFDTRASNERIAFYHASFPDFLNDASRSQKFHARSRQYQMYLARCFLHFTAGKYRTVDLGYGPSSSQRVVNRELISLITSLPPSLELHPLIGRMNPEHIFNLESDLEDMVAWLHKIPDAPPDLINTWEDYVSMSCFQKSWGNGQVEIQSKLSRAFDHIVSWDNTQVEIQSKLSREFEHIVSQSMMFGEDFHCSSESPLPVPNSISFPEPSMELIAFWRNGRLPEDAESAARRAAHYGQGWEDGWREQVQLWNETVTRLDLPDDLKFPL
ncbi:hypothetical protein C8R45DRAFT_1148606 [Mycena sanguinolenta]|nr:hypothetical protein C8R45DRAFT_1148606 [Mycena sanguinolenta]